jgi:hypothetical protein
MKQIPDASSASLHTFITALVEPGSTAVTEDWSGYSSLVALGYKHKTIIRSKRRESSSDFRPSVHRVVSLGPYR